MAIVDSSGNPIGGAIPNGSNGLIQQPIDIIPVIPDEHLGAVIGQCNAALNQGAQPNQPIGVDLGLLASLARTVRDQRKALKAAASSNDPSTEDETEPR